MNFAKSIRIAAVLPAFNEAESIVATVRAAAQYVQVIVVDDGSSDGTGDLARRAGAEVVTHKSNLGYDRALESGLYLAVELGYDAMITIDSDGQHDPSLLLPFIEALTRGGDLVIGVRDRCQRWSESLFCIVGRFCWGIEDPLCGMKGYSTTLLRRAEWFDSYESIGTELTLRAVRSSFRFEQVHIPTRERQGTSRFGVGIRANWQITRALWLGLIRARPFKT
jgi:glycosyltransferase involved in cell wall biosynthesis